MWDCLWVCVHPPLWDVWELVISVCGLVIFHPTIHTAVEGERLSVFMWNAHLAENETENHNLAPTPFLSLFLFLRPSIPPSSCLPSFPGPEGGDGSVSGAGEVTLGSLRFQSSERSDVEDLSHFVYNARRLCWSWNTWSAGQFWAQLIVQFCSSIHDFLYIL